MDPYFSSKKIITKSQSIQSFEDLTFNKWLKLSKDATSKCSRTPFQKLNRIFINWLSSTSVKKKGRKSKHVRKNKISTKAIKGDISASFAK